MKRHWPLILILGCAATLVFGLIDLFKLRFEVGDVYPGYSSLRTDPLGTMALYESLEKIRGISVRRDFRQSNRLPEEPGAVYLHLAARPYRWTRIPIELFHEIENFTRRGGRLVITYVAQTEEPLPFNIEGPQKTNSVKSGNSETKEKQARKEEPSKGVPGKKKKKLQELEMEVSLVERWGLQTAFQPLLSDGEIYEPARVSNQTKLALPQALEWHSGVVFTNLPSSWQIVYARGKNPVVIERTFGRGSVVIATDSYHISNEALLRDRHADFLAWLIGSGKIVVFDEAHLGIMETGGVATLMRNYRLHGLVAGLVLLAGLYIWKTASRLVPLPAERERQDYVPGRDSAAGFANLLRRSIPRRELLKACYSEWKGSAGSGGKYSREKLQKAESLFQSAERNPIKVYADICGVLKNAAFRIPSAGHESIPPAAEASVKAPNAHSDPGTGNSANPKSNLKP